MGGGGGRSATSAPSLKSWIIQKLHPARRSFCTPSRTSIWHIVWKFEGDRSDNFWTRSILWRHMLRFRRKVVNILITPKIQLWNILKIRKTSRYDESYNTAISDFKQFVFLILTVSKKTFRKRLSIGKRKIEERWIYVRTLDEDYSYGKFQEEYLEFLAFYIYIGDFRRVGV